jgi:hypothetical protein
LILGTKVIVHISRIRWWLCEVEDRLVDFEIPNNNLTVLTCTGKNVWDNSIPAYWCDSRSFMMVWNSWLENVWWFDIGWDILDKNFRTSTGQKILFVRVEFDWAYRNLMDLVSWDTTLTHFECFHCAWSIKKLSRIPESDSSIFHTTCNQSKFIFEIDPIKWCKLSGRLWDSLECQATWAVDIVLWDSKERILFFGPIRGTRG